MKFRMISYFLILISFTIVTLHFFSTINEMTGYTYGNVRFLLSLIPSLTSIFIMQINHSIRSMVIIEQKIQKSFFITINYFSILLICLIWYFILTYDIGYALGLTLRSDILVSMFLTGLFYAVINFILILILLRSMSFFRSRK